MVLQDNGGDNLTVIANGSFTFATKLASGGCLRGHRPDPAAPGRPAPSPAAPAPSRSANVTNVAVTCTTNAPSPAVGGTVTGLTGSVVLQDNGGDNLTVTANGAFTFATKLASGATYAVTVQTQPAGQTCTVTNGTGTIGSANVTNVAVSCTYQRDLHRRRDRDRPDRKRGPAGQRRRQPDRHAPTAPSPSPPSWPAAAPYAVTVQTQPAGQTCTVTNGTGTIGSANVTNVAVSCTTNAHLLRSAGPCPA